MNEKKGPIPEVHRREQEEEDIARSLAKANVVSKRHHDNKILEKELVIKELRDGISVILQCLGNRQDVHMIVDMRRPRQTLRTYLRRLLNDTKPIN